MGTTVCATARGAPPDELSSGTRPPTPGVSSVRVRDDDDDDASDADDETFGRKSPPVIVREPRRVVHPVASSTPSRFRAKNDVPGSPAAEPRARFSRCSPDAYETRGRRARRAHRDEKTKHKKKKRDRVVKRAHLFAGRSLARRRVSRERRNQSATSSCRKKQCPRNGGFGQCKKKRTVATARCFSVGK